VISATCNMFRALTDMYDSFYSVQSMIDYFARDNYNMSSYSRPGAWNDPDQVTRQPLIHPSSLSLSLSSVFSDSSHYKTTTTRDKPVLAQLSKAVCLSLSLCVCVCVLTRVARHHKHSTYGFVILHGDQDIPPGRYSYHPNQLMS